MRAQSKAKPAPTRGLEAISAEDREILATLELLEALDLLEAWDPAEVLLAPEPEEADAP